MHRPLIFGSFHHAGWLLVYKPTPLGLHYPRAPTLTLDAEDNVDRHTFFVATADYTPSHGTYIPTKQRSTAYTAPTGISERIALAETFFADFLGSTGRKHG
jgi:hypothetical protein